MKRPIIGVTGPDRGGLAAWWFTALAILRAGGRPRRIRPRHRADAGCLDGLVIGGGADVSPGLYGQRPRRRTGRLTDRSASGWRRVLGWILFPLVFVLRRVLTTKHGGPAPDRDRLEQGLIDQARRRRLPVLGICRGMQLINVALGGTLHQQLEGFYDEYPAIRSVLPRKCVYLQPGSHLAELLGPDRTWVNALHSQAIDRLAEGLLVSAREANGIIQGIEQPGEPWLVGVQWHPEYLPQRRRQQGLFRELVRQAGRTESS